MPGYFDKDSKTLTFYEWANLLVDDDYRRIGYAQIRAYTEAGDEVELEISTIWLGLNMGVYNGPIRIFETLVVAPSELIKIARYASLKESLAGHAKTVWLIHSGQDPFSDIPPDPKCIACQDVCVLDRLRKGSWLCKECDHQVSTGKLVPPLGRLVTG